jgi:hypothetical protein
MPIPNLSDAAFPDQARVDSVDLAIMASGANWNGVISGCAVTTTGAANGSVTVAVGQIRHTDLLYTVAGNTVAITANASGFTRFDLVTVGATGTAVATAGTAAANPVFPAVPAGSVALAAVRVPNGHTGTTTIPANTIVDKREIVPDILYRNNRGQHVIQSDTDSLVALILKGKAPPAPAWPIFQIDDWNDAPIAYINMAGGLGVNDNIHTDYTVLGPTNFLADVYGFVRRGTQCDFAFDGPPGNMMSWSNACHEAFLLDRAATVGNWGVVAGCTLATVDLGSGNMTSPTGLRSAIRMSHNASGTTWIAQNGGATALSGFVAGQTVSAVGHIRFNSAAAARNANLRVSWYTAGGTQVGSDVNGSSVSVPNSGTAWTRLVIDGMVVPATATRGQIHFLINSVVSGESHDICGAGLMRGQQIGRFGPPFVASVTSGALTGSHALSEDGGLSGDMWRRTDIPKQAGGRLYVMHTGGAPNAQIWGPMDASSLYRLESDFTNSTTTQTDVTPFTVAVDANSFNMLEYELMITSAALTTGWTIGFTGPASPTYFFATCEYQTSATAWATATVQSFANFTAVLSAYVITPSIIRMRIRAQLANGANAGNINLRWASEIAASAVVIKRGSTLSVT